MTTPSNDRQRLPRQERRASLLDAASEVFAAHGYHASSMDDIAQAAGVSKPVVYQHFASKLDLYLALVDLACEELVTEMTSAVLGADGNRGRVEAAFRALYGYVSDDSSRQFRFIFESDLTDQPEVAERIWRVHHVTSELFARLIATDTSLSPDEAKLVAISLIGIAEVSARYWADDRSQISLDREAAERLGSSLAWRGIRGFPAREH